MRKCTTKCTTNEECMASSARCPEISKALESFAQVGNINQPFLASVSLVSTPRNWTRQIGGGTYLGTSTVWVRGYENESIARSFCAGLCDSCPFYAWWASSIIIIHYLFMGLKQVQSSNHPTSLQIHREICICSGSAHTCAHCWCTISPSCSSRWASLK